MILMDDFKVIALDGFHFGKDNLPEAFDKLSIVEDGISLVKHKNIPLFDSFSIDAILLLIHLFLHTQIKHKERETIINSAAYILLEKT